MTVAATTFLALGGAAFTLNRDDTSTATADTSHTTVSSAPAARPHAHPLSFTEGLPDVFGSTYVEPGGTTALRMFDLTNRSEDSVFLEDVSLLNDSGGIELIGAMVGDQSGRRLYDGTESPFPPLKSPDQGLKPLAKYPAIPAGGRVMVIVGVGLRDGLAGMMSGVRLSYRTTADSYASEFGFAFALCAMSLQAVDDDFCRPLAFEARRRMEDHFG